MAMKRTAGLDLTPASAAPDACDFAVRMPSLWEFLVETSWDDGKKRIPGSFLLFTEEGAFKAMLNDKDAGRVAFITATSLEAVMKEADLLLRDGGLDWRKSKQFKR